MIATGGSVPTDPSQRVHVPVLLGEVLEAFRGQDPSGALRGWIVDGTVGAGGHARALVEHFPELCLFGADQDPDGLRHARAELADFGARVRLCETRMSQLFPRLSEAGIGPVIGFLLDLGANSL